MFSFLLPKYVKQGRQFVKDARKILDYKRDIWEAKAVRDFEQEIQALEAGCKKRDSQQVEEAAKALNAQCAALLPKAEDAAWRENCEVFLVAIVVALAVRTFFLQPFTIPTGSMQPTLNGILGYPTTEAPPNALARAWDFAIRGRTWVDVVAKDDESIAGVKEVSWLFFFTYTRIDASKGHTYWIHAPLDPLIKYFHLSSLHDFRRGEPIARGYIDTGDHVFVDKVSYEFRPPHRGEVFVFNTENLPTGERREGSSEPNDPGEFDLPEVARLADQRGVKFDMDKPSQFYIKRLVGLPGDELRVDPPRLFINGKLAEGLGFQRVMAAQNGYEGYSNGGYAMPSFLLHLLPTPDDPFNVPPKHFMAMGDNSYNSSDSRDWGPVPQQNIMGRGLFVYWPFGPHWGFIQ